MVQNDRKAKSRKVQMDEYSKQYAREFGDTIKQRREQLGLSLRGAAVELEMAHAYLSDIEKGNERPPSQKILDRIQTVYKFDDKAKRRMLELGRKARGTVSAELASLLNSYDSLRMAMYSACDTREQFAQASKEEKLTKIFSGLQGVIEEYLEKKLCEEFPNLKGRYDVTVEVPDPSRD